MNAESMFPLRCCSSMRLMEMRLSAARPVGLSGALGANGLTAGPDRRSSCVCMFLSVKVIFLFRQSITGWCRSSHVIPRMTS